MRLQLGRHAYEVTHRPVVIGILNRTRDSFYDCGRLYDLEALLKAAEQMAGEGADVLEVGCRPGGVGVHHVSPPEETDLACETLEKLHARFDLPLAVDTWRAAVAAAAFSAGAVLGNDMSGFRDPGYLPAAARAGASVVATHIRLEPGVPDPDPHYRDVVADVERRLREHLRAAGDAGIPQHRVIVDPGLDLGKTWQQSLSLLAAIGRFAAIGPPVMLAASNKIFLGRLLGLGKDERETATAAACAAGVLRGARVLRVHSARIGRQAGNLAAALLACDGED